MGAVTFSLDPQLVGALKAVLPLELFVETGTFRGDTIESFRQQFQALFSIELSQDLYTDALARFQAEQNITLIHGDSAQALAKVMEIARGRSTMFWLDAHWCVATDTAGETSQCPLLEELRAIGELNGESVVLIDDARLFTAPPAAPHEVSQWPSFDQILQQLRAIGPSHEIMIVNDVIALFPPQAREAMTNFARDRGVDWLVMAHQANQYGALEAKEAVIQQMRASMAELNDKLSEFKQYRDLFYALPPGIRRLARVNRRAVSILRPRLGNLNQYAPRRMVPSKAPAAIPVAPPRISIVTPSYRQGGFIERTLLSVLEQNYPNLEYVVQDGGSKDETVRVLEDYSERLASWVSCPDKGQSDAINRGFSRTSGEIMAWLNSDDLLLPGSLARVAEVFRQNPDVDVVYGNRLLIDENDMEIGRWIMPGHDARVLSWADYIPQETLFWRRSIWEKTGGSIDESFRFAMDWDLLVRFRDAGAKFLHIPEFLGAFRIHEQQKTSAVISEIGFQEMDRIRLRTLGKVPTRREIRRATSVFMLRHIATDMTFRCKTRLMA